MPVLIRLLVAAALVSALGTRAAAAQSPEEKLNEAKSLFRAGQYAEVIPILSGLLYPTSQLTAADDLVDAHLLLGIAHFQQGDRTFAEREIGEALALDRNLSITTESYSREAVEFFERKKEELEREEREARDRLARARQKRRLAEVLKNAYVLEKRRYYVNFIPFGAGQFQNGHRGKAIFFAVSESVLGAASIGLYAYQVIKYPDRRVPNEEVSTVKNLQVLQIATGGLCLGLIGWGIVDSLIHYDPVIQRELDPATREYIEQEMREDEEEPERSSLRLVPTITPDGAGAALSWEF